MLHKVNILLHVSAGTAALILGILAIFFNSKVHVHRKFGKPFLFVLSIVVGTGFIGWLFFRSDPFLLILTILSGYDGFAGWRVLKLRGNHPQLQDGIVSGITLTVALWYVFQLSSTPASMSSTVVISTLAALALVTVYDLAKYFFIHRFVRTWWLYEHIYKMMAAFSAILSAFFATVVTVWRPYSQVGPSFICTLLIVYFIWRRVRGRKNERVKSLVPQE